MSMSPTYAWSSSSCSSLKWSHIFAFSLRFFPKLCPANVGYPSSIIIEVENGPLQQMFAFFQGRYEQFSTSMIMGEMVNNKNLREFGVGFPLPKKLTASCSSLRDWDSSLPWKSHHLKGTCFWSIFSKHLNLRSFKKYDGNFFHTNFFATATLNPWRFPQLKSLF